MQVLFWCFSSPVSIKAEICRLKLNAGIKRKSRGVLLMLAGGILLKAGFYATFALFHADRDFGIFMYGFTTAGIILLGAGAFLVLL